MAPTGTTLPQSDSGTRSQIEDATGIISNIVTEISDPLWQLELAALAANTHDRRARPASWFGNMFAQLAASIIALASFAFLLLRYGGTPPKIAFKAMEGAGFLTALHAEDTTRTRHLRNALVRRLAASPHKNPIVLLLGRLNANLSESARLLDPKGELPTTIMLRPLSFGSFLRALPQAMSQLSLGLGATAKYTPAIPFRERVAIAYRMVQGVAHAAWWLHAAPLTIRSAMFGHTGTTDTSSLELAMQQSKVSTVHAVHGTNIGWSFAGLSDLAVFPSGADARLGASLPAYGRCTHLAVPRPEVSPGNGDWALLTSYTHLQHPAFAEHGAGLDVALVSMVRDAAERLGQNPARIFWRPHPQIHLVEPSEKERLEKAVFEAGFTNWPEDWPYERLGDFSAAITSPSTVLTDALRLGQPAIVASLSPLQSDLLYAAHPLLANNTDMLVEAIKRVLDPKRRGESFNAAWDAIEPGAGPEIDLLLAAIGD